MYHAVPIDSTMSFPLCWIDSTDSLCLNMEIQILVATPGRLRDHIENTTGFATRLMGVKVLVLDEADHLLDMGFRKEIEKIIAAVPKQRQTLLFSATIPQEVYYSLIQLQRLVNFLKF